MGFITDADLAIALHDHMKLAPDKQLEDHWTSIVKKSNQKAYNHIIRSLMDRGYSKAQIDQWDYGAEYQKDIGVWWCLTDALSVNPDALNLQAFAKDKEDRRDEVKDAIFTINFKIQLPEGTYGQPTTGPIDTSRDLAVLDPDDPRIGQPTVL